MNQWKIGDVKITRVIESEAVWDGKMLLPNATAENVKKESDWLSPFTSEDGRIAGISSGALILSNRKASASWSIPASVTTRFGRIPNGTN